MAGNVARSRYPDGRARRRLRRWRAPARDVRPAGAEGNKRAVPRSSRGPGDLLASVAGVALALLAGCGGGGGGGGGGGPTAPGGPLQVAGTWSGYEEMRASSPTGNCLADYFNMFIGSHGDYNVTAQQTGSMVTLEIDNAVPGSLDRVAYAGVVGDSTLTADETRSVPDNVHQCRPGVNVNSHHVEGHLSLSGTSTSLNGTLTEHLEVTNVADGSSLGEITVNFIFRMSR